MNAKEAKELMQSLDKNCIKIRRELDREINRSAKSGKEMVEVHIYSEHDSNKIVKHLKRDGFVVTCQKYMDSDGIIYTYKISW